MVFFREFMSNKFIYCAINELIAISTVAVVIVCCYFYVWRRFSDNVDVKTDGQEALKIIDLIEAIGKICPVSSWNGWQLVNSNYSLPRCWRNSLPVEIFHKSLDVYGCSVIVRGCSLAVIKMIANTSKWREWKPGRPTKKFFIRPFDDPQLRYDNFMRAASIVAESGALECYRFSHLASNNLGWILFWHVKDINWTFFLVQPIKRRELDHCTLTYINGRHPLPKEDVMLKEMLFTVNSIKDAIESSSAHIIPFASYWNEFKESFTLSEPESSKDSLGSQVLPEMVKVLKLVLIPMFEYDNYTVRFELLPSDAFSSASIEAVASGSNLGTSSAASLPSTSSSQLSSGTRQRIGLSLAYVPTKIGGQTILTSVSTPHVTSIISDQSVSFAKEKDENKQNPIRAFSSDIGYQLRKISDLKKASFTSYINLQPIEKIVDDEVVEELSQSDDQSESMSKHQLERKAGHTNIYERHSSGFEILLSDPVLSEQRIADIKTRGNYSASELLAEILDASNMNVQSSIEDHSFSSSCWSFHSVVKGVTTLSKHSECSKSLSYLCYLEIPAKIGVVWKIIKNPRSRFVLEDGIKKVMILEEISEDQKIIYTYQESTHLLRKEYIDFCLLHTERKEGTKNYLAFLTLEYENCPLMDGVTRGTLLPSGWAVEPVNEENTKVTYLYQILVSSPNSLFIQDLSSSVPEAVYNLRNYVLSGPCVS